MKKNLTQWLGLGLGMCLLAGCAGQKFQAVPSGFLSTYEHLKPVDTMTWRYVDAPRLAIYTQFKIAPVEILVKNYNGRPVTPEQKQRMADYIRSSVIAALEKSYAIVDGPSPETAEIRIAVTDAYKADNRLGISVEGEIQDSLSSAQVAAVMRAGLGERYLGDWWDATSARQIIDRWTHGLRQAIDTAHVW